MSRPCSPEIEITESMPRSLIAARIKGAPYYAGSPCKRNHNGIRRTDNQECVQCKRNSQRIAAQMAKLGESGPMLLLLDPMSW